MTKMPRGSGVRGRLSSAAFLETLRVACQPSDPRCCIGMTYPAAMAYHRWRERTCRLPDASSGRAVERPRRYREHLTRRTFARRVQENPHRLTGDRKGVLFTGALPPDMLHRLPRLGGRKGREDIVLLIPRRDSFYFLAIASSARPPGPDWFSYRNGGNYAIREAGRGDIPGWTRLVASRRGSAARRLPQDAPTWAREAGRIFLDTRPSVALGLRIKNARRGDPWPRPDRLRS